MDGSLDAYLQLDLSTELANVPDFAAEQTSISSPLLGLQLSSSFDKILPGSDACQVFSNWSLKNPF